MEQINHYHKAYAEARRCLQCYEAPCKTNCPAGIDVPRFIRHIANGDTARAAEIILSSNPLGLICGYLCSQETFCQKNCTSHKMGQAIEIQQLQLYATREEFDNLDTEAMSAAPSYSKYKIAIIGAGPSGLVCAQLLQRAGCTVTVFEQREFVGGHMSYDIPGLRINTEDRERNLLAMSQGLDIKYGKKWGEDFHLADLADYHAVYVASGKWTPRSLPLKGADLCGVMQAEDILAADAWRDKKPAQVGIIGAGNVAMDVAQVLATTGVQTVHVFFIGDPSVMEALPKEREAAWQKNVIFHLISLPKEICGDNGCVSGLICSRSSVLHQADGRWQTEAVEGYDFTIPLDMLVFAIGARTDSTLLASENLQLDATGHIICEQNLATTLPGVFAGGDIIGQGRGTIVQAVGDGAKAAQSILDYLQAKEGQA